MTSGHDCIAIRAPHCSDDPWDRKRVFAREWRRLGSRLYESTSLPVLSLVPHNRPLFTCRSCKFANSYIPLCLWCAWSSPTDIAEFEAALARSPRRRVSGPDLAAYKPKSDPKPSRRSRQLPRQSTWPRNLSRDCISKPDVKPRTGIEEVDNQSSTAEIANLRVTTTSNISGTMESVTPPSFPSSWKRVLIKGLRSQIEECRMIGRALEKAVEAGRVNDAKYLRTRRQRLPPRFPLTTITTVTSTTLTSSGDDSRLARPTMTTRHPSGSLRSRRLGAAIDISTPPLAVAPKQDDDRPSTAPAPKPAGSLRRVPGESRMRKRSSQSLRERSKPSTRDTSPSERRVKGSAPATTVPSAAPSTESSPPRTPEPRLGHPSRPYYTAIRKNMSQPTPPRTPSVAPSAPQTSHLAPRPSADQARQSGDYIARSSTDYLTRMNSRERASFPRRRIGGGSVSGEVELHMALAQRRSEDSPNTRQEYVFHETRPPPPERRQHRSRLQRLSNGVRNIFFGRS